MSRTKRKLKHAGWLRHPKTQQEHRANEAAKKEGIKVRGNRSKKVLPTSYSDIPVSAAKEEPRRLLP